jgi:muramoyltetrapeptide carboxypeptidase
MTGRRPPRLRPGDLVAVASPSSGSTTPRRLDRGIKGLQRLGFTVRVGPLTSAADERRRLPQDRADELNALLRDTSVRAIFATLGGYTSNAVLDLLDYSALRADPKVIVGYSDLTTLLLACYTQAGVTTFHGPTVLPEIAEFPRMLPYTENNLRHTLSSPVPLGRLTRPRTCTDEFLAWDIDDNRPRTAHPAADWIWISEGCATGPLLGGNLDTLSVLAGTRYLPDFTGAILFWETVSTSVNFVDRALTHLDMLGVLSRIAGMLVGRSFRADPPFDADLTAHLRERFGDSGVPVVMGLDIGHSDPMLTLPLGARMSMDSRSRTLEVLDAGVC